jgi:hypothetical protein
MSTLEWIYDSRTDRYGTKTRRFGSRKLGIVVTWMGGDEHLSDSLLGQVWRLHFGAGPFDGISEGFAGADIRGRLWELPGGRGVGIGWGAR